MIFEYSLQDMYRWALESVCAVLFDQHLGCLDPNLKSDSWQQKFIDSMNTAFSVMITLMVHPKEKIAEYLNIETKAWKTLKDNLM